VDARARSFRSHANDRVRQLGGIHHLDSVGELYYQTYLNLSPIHTMLRLLPMFASGIVANVLIALIDRARRRHVHRRHRHAHDRLRETSSLP
jgi:hypothetical protein